jgi:hypothetical protein
MPDQSDTNHISADFEALVKDLQLNVLVRVADRPQARPRTNKPAK